MTAGNRLSQQNYSIKTFSSSPCHEPGLKNHMAQDNSRLACQCCGLRSPDEELPDNGNELLWGNSIELKTLDNASNDGCKFCQFLAAVFRHNAPQKHHLAQFHFQRIEGLRKLCSISYQNKFQGPVQGETDVFRFTGK